MTMHIPARGIVPATPAQPQIPGVEYYAAQPLPVAPAPRETALDQMFAYFG